MSLLDRVARFAGFERRHAEPSWSALSPGMGYFGAVTARTAENLSAVVACSTVIATSLASIPALVYRREAGKRIEADSHPLYRLTRQGVNEFMSWPAFIEHLVVSTLLAGNGLAQVQRNANGALVGLRFIPWATVSVLRIANGRLLYHVTEWDGSITRLLQDEVLHIRDRTDDGLIGISRLSRAADTLDSVQASNTFARKFLENGAQPAGFIKAPASLSPDTIARLRESFDRKYSGVANAGRIGILDGGLDWMGVQVSPEDAELLESRKFGVEEICRLFQVPPPLVQDYSHNTFTNSETAGRWFATFTLGPWARKIEAEFARSVFPTAGSYELEFDLSGFLRGDPATRWNAHKIAIETGVLDTDEVREMEGWNPRGHAPEGTGLA